MLRIGFSKNVSISRAIVVKCFNRGLSTETGSVRKLEGKRRSSSSKVLTSSHQPTLRVELNISKRIL
ncbi:hypothetical protein QYF36_005982 [Acer negundo]|nr:hypothetical protein QYF36_005982 [Acer negundo]